MSEKDRRPLGERDDDERSQPFGSNPARHRRSLPENPREVTPYEPYAAGPDIPLPRREREGGPEPSTPYRSQSPRRHTPFYGDDELSMAAAYEQAEIAEASVAGLAETAAPIGELLPADDDAFFADLYPAPVAASIPVTPQKPITAEAAAGESPDDMGPFSLSQLLRSLGTILLAAFITATILTWWTPNSFLTSGASLPLVIAQATNGAFGGNPPGPIATAEVDEAIIAAHRIGIVSGHRGNHRDTGQPDPGAICADGLTEQHVNEDIAMQVAARMAELGYNVEVFDEFDPDLEGFHGRVMISIHADSCDYINDVATGFKVASFAVSTTPELDQLLTACLIDRYGTITGLPQHPSITYDMTYYHNFAELDSRTPGAIMEVGFLYLDRAFLTGQSATAAEGIVQGLLCFLNNEGVGVTE